MSNKKRNKNELTFDFVTRTRERPFCDRNRMTRVFVTEKDFVTHFVTPKSLDLSGFSGSM